MFSTDVRATLDAATGGQDHFESFSNALRECLPSNYGMSRSHRMDGRWGITTKAERKDHAVQILPDVKLESREDATTKLHQKH